MMVSPLWALMFPALKLLACTSSAEQLSWWFLACLWLAVEQAGCAAPAANTKTGSEMQLPSVLKCWDKGKAGTD